MKLLMGAFASIGLLFAPVLCSAASENGYACRNPKGTSEGEGDALPKHYSVTPLEFKNFPSHASIGIDKNGSPQLYLLTGGLTLDKLDKATAISIFGQLKGYGESTKPSTFDVIGFNSNGPNIFHLDVEFSEAKLLSKYRIRGYGISKPEWRQVN